VEVGDAGAERLDQRRPDADDDIAAIDQRGQPGQGLLDRGGIGSKMPGW
jgi:hypothetical protein